MLTDIPGVELAIFKCAAKLVTPSKQFADEDLWQHRALRFASHACCRLKAETGCRKLNVEGRRAYH